MDLVDLLKPSFIRNNFDSFQVNELLNRVIMAVGYPRSIREGWLDSIISSEGNFDLSLHIIPSNVESILTQLNQELVKQEADLMASQMKGLVNPSLKLQHQDTLSVLEKMQKGEEKLFEFSLYLNARAYSKEKLDLLTKKIYSELNAIMIIPKTPFLEMSKAMKSIYPIQKDELKITRNITSNALSACFPFTTAYLDLDSKGIMFGLNKNNNIPIILDTYKFANYNGLILGTSGAGKSFATKLFILRNQLNGVKTMIIDPQGEYTELTEKHSGQIIKISRNSETIINPFDLMNQDLGEKMLSLMDLMKIMCGDLTEVQKSILDKAINSVYEKKGIITTNPDTWNKEPPIIEDLYKELIKEKQTSSRQEKMTYEALINRIRIYAKGSFSFINKQTNIDLTNDLVSFNIMEMPTQIKPVMMYLILDFVHKTMQSNKEKKALIIDEAWSLLRYAEHAKHIFELIKTARKFNLGITIITQETEDLLSTKAGKAVLANTSWKFLTRQEPAIIEELSEKFHLNKDEQNYLLTALPGEGLLFAMNDHIPLKVVASPEEHELITTNPNEVIEREQKMKELETQEKENLTPYSKEKNYYLRKELNPNQIEFLKENNFVEARLCGLNKSSQWYLIKKPTCTESIQHYFLQETLANYIKQFTEHVYTSQANAPDIIFQIPRKKNPELYDMYAIEIETGTQLHNKKDLQNKIQHNHKLKLKKWWFVVTKANQKTKYNEYHETQTRTEIQKTIKKIFE